MPPKTQAAKAAFFSRRRRLFFQAQSRKKRRSLLRNLYYLKIPHHGSQNNISKSLIEIMKPKVAFISAKGNKEHPHRDVVECLKAHGVEIHQTKDYQNGIGLKAFEVNRRIRFKDIYYSGK